MPISARVFIDYWNFQLQWNNRSGNARLDWTKLPSALVAKAQAVAPSVGQLTLDDIRVYASANPDTEGNLRGWLDGFLDRQPGFRVFTRDRSSVRKPIHCKNCGDDLSACPKCEAPYRRAIEKGVDSAIITDMFSLAWEGAYSVGILVTSDADMIPAVEKIQDRGQKIINATWNNYGHDLAKTCWASFSVDSLISELTRR